MDWKIKAKRFVLFIDILGFKDLVARENHNTVYKKLVEMSDVRDYLQGDRVYNSLNEKSIKVEKDQTKSFTFSDSIIVFSKGGGKADTLKILVVAHAIQFFALKINIPIKGAISYGLISVDFKKSLFFGQPIIDAYQLQEDLKILSVIVDHFSEKRFNFFESSFKNHPPITTYKVPMKYGNVNHNLVQLSENNIESGIEKLEELYLVKPEKALILGC